MAISLSHTHQSILLWKLAGLSLNGHWVHQTAPSTLEKNNDTQQMMFVGCRVKSF